MKKPKVEIILLAVVIVFLSLYLLLRNPSKINYALPQFPALEKEAIDQIEISLKGKAVTLERQDGKWRIMPQGYPADNSKISAMTDAINSLYLTALVSETKSYVIYGLDEAKAIQVKAYKGSQLLREFTIGNSASTYRHTFVKIVGDARVFHARNNFRSDFEPKADDLRDKSVMRFDKNDVSALEFISGKQKALFSVSVKPPEVIPAENKLQPPASAAQAQNAVKWIYENGKEGNKTQLDDIVEQMSQLSCEQFEETKTKADFGLPLCIVTVKGKKDHTITIFAKSEGANPHYPAVSSETPYLFYLSAYTAERIAKKLAELKNESVTAPNKRI